MFKPRPNFNLNGGKSETLTSDGHVVLEGREKKCLPASLLSDLVFWKAMKDGLISRLCMQTSGWAHKHQN